MLEGDAKFFEQWLESDKPNNAGEWRMRCPIHGDKNASATINFEKGVFHCNKNTCIGGTTVRKLKQMVKDREGSQADESAFYDPFSGIAPPGAPPGVEAAPAISEALVRGYHEALMADAAKLAEFTSRRMVPRELVIKYGIGWEAKTKRYVIPIRDEAGKIRNLRKYQLDAPEGSQKIVNHSIKEWGEAINYGSPPRLFPLAAIDEDMEATIFITEGELDALVLLGKGVTAISGTGGAKKWVPEWSKLLEGRDVVLLYDNDSEGRMGAHKAALSLANYATSITACTDLVDKPGGDATDFFAAGGTLEQLVERIEAIDAEAKPEEPAQVSKEPLTSVHTSILGTMDSSTNGRPLRMNATVTGRKNPTYSVPKSGEAVCTLDAGPKCRTCPMFELHEGSYTFDIPNTAIETLSNFIEAGRHTYEDHIRNFIGAAKCNQMKVKVEEVHTVQELFVSAPMDAEEDDFTSRRVYTFGEEFETETNTIVNLIGTTWPNPRDSRNEFYAWEVEDAETNIDSFEVTPEFVERMKQFRPERGKTPLVKAREIAWHMSNEVTNIFGRERMHMAMDLVWHSVLSFPFQNGKPIQRGWLEFVVVGDTRTGKSETAMKLGKHYGLGHVISCENASVAGIIGGATQIGNQWTLQWGDYTLNDRRLVILDEVSGMSVEVISAMTNVRSSGEAQITKIESQRTRARVRSIWISNPRVAKFGDPKHTDGVDILRNVIESPEDIARFDLAMSVREGDVRSTMINRLVQSADPTYSSEDCRDLILWAWSRKASQIIWEDGVLEHLMNVADKLGQRYVPVPPLIERASVKEKIARLAVALAVRTFSSSADGHNVIVQKRHVNDAVRFMDQLYQYENFGYYRKSKRLIRNRKIARESVGEVREWLKKHGRVAEFLIDIGGSFRAQDMEEMAHLDRDEVQTHLSYLNDKKMITKDKSQIVMEPTLQELLREF